MITGAELKDAPAQKELDIFVILNAYWEELTYKAKPCPPAEVRELIVDTALVGGWRDKTLGQWYNNDTYTSAPRSVAILLRKKRGS